MKLIFAGTPQFSVPTLQALINSEHDIVAVYTQPDKPAGRGQKLQASPVKLLAQQHNLNICQPKTLRDIDEQNYLSTWQADAMIVIAYGLILPKAVLEAPRFGCINVHASLLPRWRGAAPIQRAILAGDHETGITIMQMDTGLDTGAMLYKVNCPILATDTTQSLHDRLAHLGAEALINTLNQFEKITPTPQDETQSCYAKKISKEEAQINWQLSATELDSMVRGFNPWPIAYTYLNEHAIRIWQTQVINQITPAIPGTIIYTDKNSIDVATGKNILRLLQIQLPGSRCLPVKDILNAKADWFAVGKQFK